MRYVRTVVAYIDANSSPSFCHCIVKLSAKRKRKNEHYDAAKEHVLACGHVSSLDDMISFDESDPGFAQAKMHENFDWSVAAVIDHAGEPVSE